MKIHNRKNEWKLKKKTDGEWKEMCTSVLNKYMQWARMKLVIETFAHF